MSDFDLDSILDSALDEFDRKEEIDVSSAIILNQSIIGFLNSRPINQSISQSINQSINESINQSINQSIDSARSRSIVSKFDIIERSINFIIIKQ